MSQKKDIRQLLKKYRRGQLTSEEKRWLEDWYLNWKPEKFDISTEEVESIKHEIWQAIEPGRKGVGFRRWYVAASILICLLGGYYWLNFKQYDKPAQQITYSKNTPVAPGRDRAILTLSNGKSIVLDNVKSGKVAEDASSTIDKNADGHLSYSSSSDTEASEGGSVLNTLATPRGGQYHLVLSDGTRVWLNAASSITFPVQFANNDRVVTVTGEAYFEVSHRDRQPFKVLTATQEIKVFGTHFNVNSYADDKTNNTVLISGSVQVKSLQSGQHCLLKPGQQASTSRKDGQLTTAQANVENAVSWKNGYFIFDNQQIKDIMRIMSRWYDVDVSYEGQTTVEHFGGSFSRNLTMNEILNNLQQIGNLDFEVNGNHVVIKTQK